MISSFAVRRFVLILLLILGSIFVISCKKRVILKIATSPDKAVVLFNGAVLGETPLEYAWDGAPGTMVIKKEGFKTVSKDINWLWVKQQKGSQTMQVMDRHTIVIKWEVVLVGEE